MAFPEEINWRLYRAKQNFEELEKGASEWFNSEPGKVEHNPDANSDKPYIFKASRPIPIEFGLIVGDYLNNLRSVLDYLVWEVIAATGKEPEGRIGFPVCHSLESFNKSKRSSLRGMPAPAKSIVEQLQPYPERKPGNNALSMDVLDTLNNRHKHRRPLLTAFSPAIKPSYTPTFPHTEYELMRDGIGGERIIAYLAFKDDIVKGLEVTTVLTALMNFVGYDVLPLFEPFF